MSATHTAWLADGCHVTVTGPTPPGRPATPAASRPTVAAAAAAFSTPTWWGAFFGTCLFAALCVFLGVWQWDRREEKVTAINAVKDRYDAPAGDLTAALTDPAAFTPTTQWTPVRLHGQYLPDQAYLIRNRSLNKQPGYYQVVPFQDTATGTVLAVQRGWLPTGTRSAAPDQIPPVPTGEMAITARLRPAEPWIAKPATPNQALRITPANLFGDIDGLELRGFGVLADPTKDATSADQATQLTAAPKPTLDEGSHLSYTFQWFVFAIGGFVGLAVIGRRSDTWRQLTGAPPPVRLGNHHKPGSNPGHAKLSDADEEDAMIDEQLSNNQP